MTDELTIEEMLAIPDFAAAVTAARPEMEASVGEENGGTLLLAAWASAHLRWSDVCVPTHETSFEDVWREAETAYGKRMGHLVTLIQTTAANVEGHPVHTGLVETGEAGQHTISFFAVGDVDALLSDDAAWFHGVVTGTYAYTGSSGVPQRAVTMVGMFDSPANRRRCL